MKKLLFAILTILLSFSLLAVSAEPDDSGNYLANTKWEAGYSKAVRVEDGVTIATGIDGAWCTPQLSIYKILLEAMGDNDDVELVFTFDIRITLKEDATDDSAGARLLFRGNNKTKFSEDDEWNEAYEEALDGEYPLFMSSQGNIMYYTGDSVILTEEWTTVYLELYFTRPQIENDFVTEWKFCLDTITKYASIASIEIKNTGLYLSDDAPEAPVPDETPTPTPNNATATPEPTPWMTPDLGQSTETEAPVVDNEITEADNSFNPVFIIAGAAAVVVVAAAAVVTVIVIKKKRSK